MSSNNEARLLAASIPIRSALRALDENAGNIGQGYHIEQLVVKCRILAALVDALTAQESTVPSGSVRGPD